MHRECVMNQFSFFVSFSACLRVHPSNGPRQNGNRNLLMNNKNVVVVLPTNIRIRPDQMMLADISPIRYPVQAMNDRLVEFQSDVGSQITLDERKDRTLQNVKDPFLLEKFRHFGMFAMKDA